MENFGLRDSGRWNGGKQKPRGATPSDPHYRMGRLENFALREELAGRAGGAESFQEPLLQGGEKMLADIAKGETDAGVGMRVDDASGRLEKVRVGEDFNENGGADRWRIG
jgi:hypothetical protein